MKKNISAHAREVEMLKAKMTVIEELINECESQMKCILDIWCNLGTKSVERVVKRDSNGDKMKDEYGNWIWEDKTDEDGNLVYTDDYGYKTVDIESDEITDEQRIQYKAYDDMIETLIKLAKGK